PVHELLGGKLRDSIKVYSWIGGDLRRVVIRAGFQTSSTPGIMKTLSGEQLLSRNGSFVRFDRGAFSGVVKLTIKRR
ncbi:hypothetical protein EN972_17965, partial [Mesorhizobium sp. M7A.F.Ca.CA.002.07.1.1]